MNPAVFISSRLQLIDKVSGGGGSGSSFSKSQIITVKANETLIKVPVLYEEGMTLDYRGLRFVQNNDGSSVDKLYLPSYIESSDALGATVWVAFRYPKAIDSTFVMLWGNPDSVSVSNGRNAYGAAGWYFNNLDREVQYEVNKYVAYDMPLDDDATYQHAASPHKNPATGQIGRTWKRAELANEHGASEGSKIMFRMMTGYDSNNYPTFSTPVVAHDNTKILFPSINATVTSVTNNGGVARFNHAGAAIYTVGAYLRSAGFSVPGYNGDFLISATGAGYYEVTQTKENGQAPVAYVSDSTGSSQALQIFVGINSNFMWTGENTGVILLDLNLVGSNTSGYTSVGTRRVHLIRVANTDTTPTFTDPVRIGDDVYSAMSESHYIARNGWMFWQGHGISRQDLTYPVLIFWSKDNGETINLLTVASPIGQQLNESSCVQIANADMTYQNKLYYWIRNEASPFIFHQMIVTMDEDAGTISNDTPVPSYAGVWDPTSQSCPDICPVDMGHGRYERLFFMFGDTHIMSAYMENDGTLGTDQMALKNVGYPGTANQPIMNGSSLSCGRPQPKGIDMGNQRVMIDWCRNMRSGSPELSSNYLQFFDASLMALTTSDANTFTAVRPRPEKIQNGILRFGILTPGYRATSNSTFTVPTSHPTQITITLNAPGVGEPALLWNPAGGDAVVVRNATSRYVAGTTVSYDVSTRVLVLNSSSNVGSTPASSWTVDLGNANDTGNLRSNQLLKSRWYKPGNTTKGWVMKATAKAQGAVLYQAGFKKDETLGVSTITITGTGAGRIIWRGSNFSPRIGLIGDTGQMGSGATEADYVAAFAASVERLGVGRVLSTTSNTVVVQAPDGYGTSANGLAPALTLSGSANASAGNFVSATTAEAASSYQNVIAETAAVPGVFHIKNSNDTFNQTFTQGADFNEIEVDISSAQAIGKVNGVTVITKLPANGNGIPSWQAAFALGLSTTLADPTGLIQFKKARIEPRDQTVATLGPVVTGTWTERADGYGLN